MARSAASMLAPDMADVQRTIEKVTEASIVANSILESLHGLEGIEHINTEQVRQMQSQVGRVTTAAWELGGILKSANKETDGQKSARILASLEQVIELAEQYENQVIALQKRVEQFKQTTLYWLNLAPTLAMIVLGWIAISQVIVIVVMMRVALARRIQIAIAVA
jgi:hypothetical protein